MLSNILDHLFHHYFFEKGVALFSSIALVAFWRVRKVWSRASRAKGEASISIKADSAHSVTTGGRDVHVGNITQVFLTARNASVNDNEPPVEMGATNPHIDRVGNLYWMSNNLAFVAFATSSGDDVGALRELDNAVHHARKCGIPEPLMGELIRIQGAARTFGCLPIALVADLQALWTRIGRWVQSRQSDFKDHDIL